MALSAKRTADTLAGIFRSRFGITIDGEGKQYLEAIYEAMIQEIKTNLEAEGVESPATGYTVTVTTDSGSEVIPVDGISVTGTVTRGKFR